MRKPIVRKTTKTSIYILSFYIYLKNWFHIMSFITIIICESPCKLVNTYRYATWQNYTPLQKPTCYVTKLHSTSKTLWRNSRLQNVDDTFYVIMFRNDTATYFLGKWFKLTFIVNKQARLMCWFIRQGIFIFCYGTIVSVYICNVITLCINNAAALTFRQRCDKSFEILVCSRKSSKSYWTE